MKRLLLILLMLFFLVGCAGEELPETSEPSTEPETETTDPGLYMPDNSVEQQTGGAVRVYDPKNSGYTWMSVMGNKLLLASGEDSTELTVLAGDKCQVSASVSVEDELSFRGGDWQITAMGFAYVSQSSRSVIYMDSDLRQLASIPLPEDAAGNMLIDPKNDNIYYCVDDQIRALDTNTGISRLIRKQSCTSQELTGIYFDGSVLSCRLTGANGEEGVVYLSSQTGETLSTDTNITALTTHGNQYFATRNDGVVRQQIFGALDISAQSLNAPGELQPVLGMNGVVSYTVAESGLELRLYDLRSGQQTAGVTLPGVTAVTSFAADESNLWVLAYEGTAQRIYKWDAQKSPMIEDAVVTGPLYTASAPDVEGLQACQQRVDALNKTHGLAIRIWQDAVKDAGGYVLEPEYQTEAINKVLDELEPVLALFPENFLYKSVNTRVRICIVRSISGEATAEHYWLNDDSFIILSAGVNVYEELLKATGYVISTNVMGNSPILDGWSSLNPEDFTYGVTEGFEQYLTGETMAFADAGSMESVTEDRSRLFWYAMKADNAQMFQSPAMQGKLVLLCKGIRDAWRLERKTDVYPWEQYLHESIAYVKK